MTRLRPKRVFSDLALYSYKFYWGNKTPNTPANTQFSPCSRSYAAHLPQPSRPGFCAGTAFVPQQRQMVSVTTSHGLPIASAMSGVFTEPPAGGPLPVTCAHRYAAFQCPHKLCPKGYESKAKLVRHLEEKLHCHRGSCQGCNEANTRRLTLGWHGYGRSFLPRTATTLMPGHTQPE